MRTFLLLGASVGLLAAADAKFVPLFDGKTLNGWEVCNGSAKYTIEKGVVTGTTAEGSPNSFLCSKKEYGDFVLEFEVLTDPALNTGVQLRSHQYPEEKTVNIFDGAKMVVRKQPKGRVHGYQVEIGNEAGRRNGGIYDEARRGWVDVPKADSPCVSAFKDNQWNKYRVVAFGDSIQTWVNGAPCADLRDSMDQTGFLGLQVHQFKGDKPAQVKWRNLRIQDNGRHVWKPLWDGKTLNGWNKSGGAEWTIENGAIHAVSNADPKVAYLTSGAAFKDVTARLRFKIAKGNSGWFLRCDPSTHAGYEIEIDEAKRTGGYWDAGGRNWVTGPEDNAGVKKGDWNELTASLHGHRVVLHLNGIKTVDIPNDTPGRLEGHMALQAHGAKKPTDVWFQSVEVLVPAK
jgi:hypothetical protein